MNRQHLDIQIEYLRRELTSISQELHYLEGQKARMLRIRQSRLSAELERVQCQRIEMPRIDAPISIQLYPITAAPSL